jgi:uncharacterized membrane protein
LILGLQALLALAYAVLAHLAGDRHDERLGACALAVLAVLLVLPPLARGRLKAWIALALLLGGVFALYRAGQTAIPILLVPTAILALVAFWFGRSLCEPRGPLITRIVAAMDHVPVDRLATLLRDYTRALTRAWAWLLGALSALNLLLACIAVPDGLLARAGWTSPWSVSHAQWSWFAGVCNYGIVAAFFIGEYHARKRRFPGRYRNLADFLRRLASLGPAFWRDFLR